LKIPDDLFIFILPYMKIAMKANREGLLCGYYFQRITTTMKRICVIDGQGGGIGATLIKYLKEAYGEAIDIIGLGTNAIATAQMLKAGANRGASGENAIVQTAPTADLIAGPISITWANAMLGEVTPKMAEAVMACPVTKVLLPLTQEQVALVGLESEPLPHLVRRAVREKIQEVLDDV
jgi:hypothetical protein